LVTCAGAFAFSLVAVGCSSNSTSDDSDGHGTNDLPQQDSRSPSADADGGKLSVVTLASDAGGGRDAKSDAYAADSSFVIPGSGTSTPVDTCASVAFLDQKTVFYRFRRADGTRSYLPFPSHPPDVAEGGGFALFNRQNTASEERQLVADLYDAATDDDMLSTALTATSYTVNSLLGYTATAPNGSLVELRRYVSTDGRVHIASISPADVPTGFSPDGTTLGYACPP
jgi:hypothetical protein